MFKTTGKSGRRNAGSGGVKQSARISGLSGLRAAEHPGPHAVAFQPDSQQEHGFDSNSPRLGGLEKS